MSHVAIIGAKGALGSDLVAVFRKWRPTRHKSWQVTAFTHAELDVTNPAQVRQQLIATRPDLIINTAAYNRVRDAESHAAEAFAVNATGPANVAACAREMNAVCVHYSTDYVFDGKTNRPYTEADPTGPVNVYGASKLAGERAVLEASPRNLVLRTAGLYGEIPTSTKGENFVQIVWRLAHGKQEIFISDRETCNPTWTLELAGQTLVLVERAASGLFHAVQEDNCTWQQFAQSVLDLSGERVRVLPRKDEAETGLNRPRYTALENARLKTLGLNRMQPWQTALKDFLCGEGGRRLRERSATRT